MYLRRSWIDLLCSWSGSQSRRPAPQRAGTGGGGRKKAGCAVARSILIIVWHLLNDPAARYRDLGSDWHARHTDRSRKARNARRQLEALGYDVEIGRAHV